MVLMQTTEHTGSCFVRTDQLDGETDWKLRLAIPATQNIPMGTVSSTEDVRVTVFSHAVTLAHEVERDGYAFGSVCMSVRMGNSKIIVPIDLLFLHKKICYTCASVLSKMDSIIYLRILHHLDIGQNTLQHQTCFIMKTSL